MFESLKQKKNSQKIKMRIKTGDLVKVINGKEKGKTGEVLKTIPQENKVVIKGINLRTKHIKPTQEGESGRILTEETSMHASNVMFFSKDKNLTSRIEYFIDKEGVKKRRLKKTGEVIDWFFIKIRFKFFLISQFWQRPELFTKKLWLLKIATKNQ